MKKLLFFVAIIFTISSNAQDTVKMENLKSIKGLSYKQDSKVPFTGLVATYYANGKISILTNFLNGLKSGKIQIFYDSGKPRVITYENENSINYGEMKIWNENGSLAFEGNWINGKLIKKNDTNPYSGKIIIYYSNGKTNEIAEFIDGWWNGKQIIYDRNGNISSECLFKNNKIVDCKKF